MGLYQTRSTSNQDIQPASSTTHCANVFAARSRTAQLTTSTLESALESMEGRFRKFGDQDRRKGGDARADQRRADDRRAPEDKGQDRGLVDWLESEQQEERRSGLDRRSGMSRRGSLYDRRDERRSIPFSVAPRGEVRAEDGRHWHCTLWDVSRRGLCVVANGSFELPLGRELNLTLFEVVGLGSFTFTAHLRWFASDEFQTYLGLQFHEPGTLPPDTFLEHYLQTEFDV